MSGSLSDDECFIMSLAQEEALRWNHEYIGTEHVLLAMLRDEAEECAARQALNYFDLTLEKARSAVARRMQAGPPMTIKSGASLPRTPRVKKVLEYALEESQVRRAQQVNSGDILIGLFREVECLAAQIFIDLELRLDRVRRVIERTT